MANDNTGEEKKSNRFSDFLGNIEEKIANLTTLEIKTVVGDFDVDEEANIAPRAGSDFKLLNSRIDLIDGDMTTFLSNELVYEKYQWLRDFHASKEERGHQMITDNIRALFSLMDLYKSMKGEGDSAGGEAAAF